MKKCLSFLLLFIFGCTSQQSSQSSLNTQSMTWEELAPYVGRHIGMRQNDRYLFEFDIGGEFYALTPEQNPQMDAWVNQVLKKHEPQIAGLLQGIITKDVFQRQRVIPKGEKVRFTPEEEVEVSRRIWQKVMQQDPPSVQTHLKFLLVRELGDKITLDGIVLKPTLSSRSQIRWKDIRPYFSSFIRLIEQKNGLTVRICLNDNQLSSTIRPKNMDWNIAMTVFDAMTFHLMSSTAFHDHLNRLIDPLENEFKNWNNSPHSSQAKKEKLTELEKKLKNQINKDYAVSHLAKGYIAYQFEQQHLPPLVD